MRVLLDRKCKPLSPYEVEMLARYNAEVSRGLVHTKEYADKMSVMQREFDRRMKP